MALAACLCGVTVAMACGVAMAAGVAFRPAGLKLYQADDVVNARIAGGPMQLGGFVHGLSQAVRSTLGASPPAFGGAVVVIARPGGAWRHWLVTTGPIPKELDDQLQRALDQVSAPTVQGGPLALALLFEAGGSTELPPAVAPQLPTPAAWRMALGSAAGFPMQDAELAKVWPGP